GRPGPGRGNGPVASNARAGRGTVRASFVSRAITRPIRSDQDRHRSRPKPINEPRDQVRSASRDGGNDADLVVLGHRSGQVVEVANVLVVKVDIDKAAQFLAVEEPL